MRRLASGLTVPQYRATRSRSFSDYLVALRNGTISFRDFERGTAQRWKRYAHLLYYRWGRFATGVDEADVYQELILAAWLFLPQWDRDRASIEDFIVYNACDKAKKWLHVQRAAKRSGNADAAPTRREVLAVVKLKELPDRPTQEDLARLEIALDLSVGQGARFEGIMVELARHGSIDVVADDLYRCPVTRREYHLVSEQHAHLKVRAVARLATQVAATRVAAAR